MVSFQQALDLVLAQTRSFGKEEVPLTGAFGRVLAEPVRADRDYPPFDRATMDGYALRLADLRSGIRTFQIVETVYAGVVPNRRVGAGDCVKIMTGAAVPGDADLVIRREDVAARDNEMTVNERDPEPWRPFLNVARKGEDLVSGGVVIAKACRCDPAVMGLLATLGRTTVTVSRIPRVALITTGNEVVEPGHPLNPVQIRNSNRWMLEAAFRRKGVVPATCLHATDDREQLKSAILTQLAADVLILTGGVSAGDADFVPSVLAEVGVKELYHKIAMRPGKPGYCGLLPGGGVVFGLPGNPFSCLAHFILLIGPYLESCWGLQPQTTIGVPMRDGRSKRAPLDEFFPVKIEGLPATVRTVPLNGSGDIRMGMEANALALHPAGAGDLSAGAPVECYRI